jgi:hypothetical protein
MKNIYELVPFAPFGVLVLITYIVFFSKKFRKAEQLNYANKKPFSNAIKKNFESSEVTFYDWSSRGGKLQLSSKLGFYALFKTKEPLHASSVEKLAKIFDVLETDESESVNIYTLKKYKVYFDTKEFDEIVQKFDLIIKEEETENGADVGNA